MIRPRPDTLPGQVLAWLVAHPEGATPAELVEEIDPPADVVIPPVRGSLTAWRATCEGLRAARAAEVDVRAGRYARALADLQRGRYVSPASVGWGVSWLGWQRVGLAGVRVAEASVASSIHGADPWAVAACAALRLDPAEWRSPEPAALARLLGAVRECRTQADADLSSAERETLARARRLGLVELPGVRVATERGRETVAAWSAREAA